MVLLYYELILKLRSSEKSNYDYNGSSMHPLWFDKLEQLWPSKNGTGYYRICPFGPGRNYKPVGRWQYRGHRVLVTNGYYPNDPFGSYLNGIYGNHGSVCVYAKVVGN